VSEPEREVQTSDEEPALVEAAPPASPLDGGEAVSPGAIGGHRTGSGPVRVLVLAVALAFVAFGVPGIIDRYWLQIVTSVVIYSIVTLGLGLLIGRAGMVSLCQFLLLAIGAWVALRLDYATSLPFPLLILIAGIVTGLIGALI
jgi:branched-chain amino acid transport system permease protein